MYNVNLDLSPSANISVEDFKENLTCALVPSPSPAALANTPHQQIDDIALVAISGSYPFDSMVTNQIARNFCMTPSEVLETAKDNTTRTALDNYRLDKLSDIVLSSPSKEIDDPEIYVLSNKSAYNGAVLATCSEIMNKVHNTLRDEDLILLPSSRHEFLVIPSRSMSDPNNLHMLSLVVKEVNGTLSRNDYLSDSIYHHRTSDRLISKIDFTNLDHKICNVEIMNNTTSKVR